MVKKSHLEYVRSQTTEKFNLIKQDWIDVGSWILPHRTKYLMQQQDGRFNARHLVDQTATLALRSFVAGFLEGNTSASRPWARVGISDTDRSKFPANKRWLQTLTQRCLTTLANSNFYHEAGQFYYDYGTFNSGAHFIEELRNGRLHFHTLVPGSYKILNDAYGVANILVMERTLAVKALVDTYGRKVDGKVDWSNISPRVKKLYEDGTYSQKIETVTVVMENPDFDLEKPVAGTNRQWISLTYELGSSQAQGYVEGQSFGQGYIDQGDEHLYLKVSYSKRKPFLVGRSQSSNNYEYGEKGPGLDALGLVKSLNKKALGKDEALEKLLRPTLQGPASIKKSYITHASNSFVPLDPTAAAQGGLKPINQIGAGIEYVMADVTDLRGMVDKLFYADFLLFLSKNPKTRTATETNAIVAEQQLVIGPNLQSLNQTYNIPVFEFVMDFVLDMDPYMPEAPEDLQGQFLRIDFVSVFAQAQKAADLPAIDRYMGMVERVAQIDPSILHKSNLDVLADLYEDRLFLPEGLNRPQVEVDARREQAQAMAMRQQQMEQALQGSQAVKNIAQAQSTEQV